MLRPRAVLFLLLAPLFVLAVVGERPAYGVEHWHHVGASGGLSLLKVDDKSTMSVGAGVGLHYTYGLSDQFNFVAEGTSSIVALDEDRGPKIPTTRPGGIESLGIGTTYVIDVLQWVPYVGVLGSSWALHGGSMNTTRILFGAQLAAGLDYQISRQLTAGFAYRQHVMLSDLSTYPSYSTFFLRAEYTWGFL